MTRLFDFLCKIKVVTSQKLTLLTVFSQLLQARRKLAGYLENEYGHRDGLMLDVCLENWFKVQVEKTQFGELGRDQLLDVRNIFFFEPGG